MRRNVLNLKSLTDLQKEFAVPGKRSVFNQELKAGMDSVRYTFAAIKEQDGIQSVLVQAKLERQDSLLQGAPVLATRTVVGLGKTEEDTVVQRAEADGSIYDHPAIEQRFEAHAGMPVRFTLGLYQAHTLLARVDLYLVVGEDSEIIQHHDQTEPNQTPTLPWPEDEGWGCIQR